jgi:hypothetical protein
VQFRIDGQNLGPLQTTPYQTGAGYLVFRLVTNVSGFSNGSHVLSAVAKDVAGNSGTSAGVTVTKSN